MKSLLKIISTIMVLAFVSLTAKDFLLTPANFPVLGELDPFLIDQIFTNNPDTEASLASIKDQANFQALVTKYDLKLFGGPTLGDVTSNEAKVWVRTPDEAQVKIQYSTNSNLNSPSESSELATKTAGDLAGIIQLNNLNPSTQYFYNVTVNGQAVYTSNYPSFKTAPVKNGLENFTIAFGGGARYVPENERVWDTIALHNPQALLLLGDNVYHDDRNQRNRQRVHYYRRHLRPEWQNLTGSAPVYAVWDDHDFCGNDCGGGEGNSNLTWKIPTLDVYKENWANPYYGGADSMPGVWFDFTIGDVDFFMLDSRMYRDPSLSTPTMIGVDQKNWLLDKLSKSTGVFKVIVSPVPMASGVKPGSNDPWDGFQTEREEIFSFIEANNIGGVFMLSADRHRSDHWSIPRPAGYDFQEFMSSRLTNLHVHPVINNTEMVFGFNNKQSFGLIHFNFDDPGNPTFTYEITSIDNESIYTAEIKRTDLGSYTPVNPGFRQGNSKPSVLWLPGVRGQLAFQIMNNKPVYEGSGTRGTLNLFTTNGDHLHSGKLVNSGESQNIYFTDIPNFSPGVYLVKLKVELEVFVKTIRIIN